MNKSEAKELLDSFELYAHDEFGETFVSQIKDDFLKWKYGEIEKLNEVQTDKRNSRKDCAYENKWQANICTDCEDGINYMMKF